MNYFYSITDEKGYVHSIDMCTYQYLLTNKSKVDIANELHAIARKYDAQYWEKLKMGASSKYNFFENVIHINSIHISFGYHKKNKNKQWIVVPMLQIRCNPNKHSDDPLTQEVLAWIHQNCTGGHLHMYDYAIDVDTSIDMVQVINSRKEKGLYKGTKYWGQRSSHGFLKIYNKSKEQDLDYELTRIEHTLSAKEKLSLEDVLIIKPDSIEDFSELDNLNRCIVQMCLALQEKDVDYVPFIEALNYRRKQKILPYLNGASIKIEYDIDIIQELIDECNKLFHASVDGVTGRETRVEKKPIRAKEYNSFTDDAERYDYFELIAISQDEFEESQNCHYYTYICQENEEELQEVS